MIILLLLSSCTKSADTTDNISIDDNNSIGTGITEVDSLNNELVDSNIESDLDDFGMDNW